MGVEFPALQGPLQWRSMGLWITREPSQVGHEEEDWPPMDDQAALIARRAVMAPAAWFNAPADVEGYRRLAATVDEWNAYCAPTMDPESGVELLDGLADVAPPQSLGDGLSDLEVTLRRAVRDRL